MTTLAQIGIILSNASHDHPVYFIRSLHFTVPDSPEDVKVLIVSATSLLVAWKPPVHRNGLITMYSIYAKTLDKRVRTELPFIPLVLSHTAVPRGF